MSCCLLQVVPEPCDVSKATDIVFDASFSRDGSGRPLVKWQWSQFKVPDPATPTTLEPSNDFVLATAISAANAANGGAGSVR